MKSLSTFALLMLGTGCSVGSFNGSVAGTTFSPKDAISASAHFSATTSSGSDLPDLSVGLVIMTNTGTACDDIKSKISREKETGVFFYMMSVADTALQPSKGDYAQDNNGLNAALLNKTAGKFAIGEFASDDASCNSVSGLDKDQGTMTAGKVTIDSADSSGTHGSYSVTFGGADKVTGSFSASDCAALQDTLTYLAYSLGYDVQAPSTSNSQNANSTCKP